MQRVPLRNAARQVCTSLLQLSGHSLETRFQQGTFRCFIAQLLTSRGNLGLGCFKVLLQKSSRSIASGELPFSVNERNRELADSLHELVSGHVGRLFTVLATRQTSSLQHSLLTREF